MVFSNNLLLGAAGADGGGYEIDQSIRFNQADSARLTRTPASAGNRKTFTFSCWLKRGNISTLAARFFTGYQDVNNQFEVYFQSTDKLVVAQRMGGTWYEKTTDAVYRDSSAWYHFVWYWDTTDGTAEDRTRAYINGERVNFASGSDPSLNADGMVNATIQHEIAGEQAGSAYYYDGYMAEIHFIDGTALDPTSFGETNDDGVWIPKEYDGSYGTNGNDFTSSGLATTDQMLDTPTDNYCVLSPIDKSTNFTLSDGNLTNSNGANAHAACFSTIAFDASDTDGWYWEVDCDSFQSTGFAVLIADEAVNQPDITTDPTTQPAEGNLWAHRRYNSPSNGATTGVGATGSWTNYGPAAVNGDVIGYCVKNGKLFIAINNTWLESSDPATEASPAFSNLTGNLRVGVNRFGDTGTDVTTLNFGQTGFTYTPPTGAKAISTANLPTPSITDGSAYFQPVLYTGTTGSQDITFSGNSDLAPDWLWFKARNAASNHFLFDKIRGALEKIEADRTVAEATSTGSMTAFGTDGFSLGDGGANNDINGVSGTTYVAWGWKANGAGSSNTDGSISSTVSADTTAGFSIVKYTGTGANATVGHGLGVVPKMIFIKDTTNSESWIVYNETVGNDGNLYLNLTNAKATQAVFQNTTPTSSVFYLGTTDGANKASGVHVAYCFAEIPGYSRIGSYTGNGSTDGPFVYTGFKPAFIMTKRTDSTSDWTVEDTTRSTFNLVENALFPNLSIAEDTTGDRMDILSNGFKLRTTAQPNVGTLIYMAFAENPFGGDGVAPATAR